MTHIVEYGPHRDMPEIQPATPERVVPLLIGATVEEIERELILQTLARCEGNRTHAARVLGFSVRTLRNKIRQYAANGADIPPHAHAGTPDESGSE